MSLMTITRGDSKTFTLTLRNPDGSALNPTGMDVTFTAKRSRWDADADAVFQKTIGDGLTIADASAGQIAIAFLAEETESITDLRSLRADVQVQSGEDVKTAWQGKLKINPDVTRTTV
jgi:hypothetical protein